MPSGSFGRYFRFRNEENICLTTCNLLIPQKVVARVLKRAEYNNLSTRCIGFNADPISSEHGNICIQPT